MRYSKIITEKEIICQEIEVKAVDHRIEILKLVFNRLKNYREYQFNIKKMSILV